MTDGPYSGLSVLELTDNAAAAYAGMLMSDRGADVIKIEPPRGAKLRYRHPHAPGESKHYQWLCRGKRSVVLAEGSAESHAILKKLAATVDVFLCSWPMTKLRAAGLDPEALCEANERLIFVHDLAWGREGERIDRPANDLALQTMSGLLLGENKWRSDGAPDQVTSTEISVYPGGQVIAMATGAALFHRERSGRGQYVETSQLGTVLLLRAASVTQNTVDMDSGDTPANRLREARSRGASFDELDALSGATALARGPLGNIYYREYTTADGAIFIGALTRGLRDKVRAAMETDFLHRDDPRFAEGDEAYIAECRAFEQTFLEKFRTLTNREWKRLFDSFGVPCAEVIFPEDLSGLEQARANHYITEINHPRDGRQLHAGNPIRFMDWPEPDLQASPALGEHTEAVLGELGTQVANISQMR